MRHAAVARRELGVPTAFNFLGPLTNPAQPTYAAVGVADARMAPLMAGVFAGRGRDAAVFRGDDGLDELTLSTTSTVWWVRGGSVEVHTVDPQRLGLTPAPTDALRGQDAAYNAQGVIRELFAGARGPVRDAVVLNAAVALALVKNVDTEIHADLREGMDRAEATIDSGAAAEQVQRWVAAQLAPGGLRSRSSGYRASALVCVGQEPVAERLSRRVTWCRSSAVAGICMTSRRSGWSTRRVWTRSSAIGPVTGCSTEMVTGWNSRTGYSDHHPRNSRLAAVIPCTISMNRGSSGRQPKAARNCAQNITGRRFPLWHAGAVIGIGEHHPQQVAPSGRHHGWIAAHLSIGRVPRQVVVVGVVDAGEGWAQCIDRALEMGCRFVDRIVALGGGQPGQSVQVTVLIGGEQQGAGQGLDHLRGGGDSSALLQPGVLPKSARLRTVRQPLRGAARGCGDVRVRPPRVVPRPGVVYAPVGRAGTRPVRHGAPTWVACADRSC